MLSLRSPHSRRDFLTIGALGGLALPGLFAGRGYAQSSSNPLVTGKSVIFLFQQGGPSQHETFDPKPDAPDGTRTVTGVTQTAIPGVTFGETFPQLASRADKFTVVRSFATGNGGHNIRPIVGPETLNANVGALFSSVAGATHPVTGLPTNAVLLPQSVDDGVTQGQGRGDLASTGGVGGAFAPFQPGGRGQLMKNLTLTLDPAQFESRRHLLAGFSKLQGELDSHPDFRGFDNDQRQAMEVLLSGTVANALDLTREDPKTLARYDTGRYVAKDGWKKANRGKRGYYTGHAKTIGKALLLARRLCEAGCGFVTVHTAYEGVWDVHGDGNNLGAQEGIEAVGRPFDHAVAAFIDDLEARGLSEQIMLVCTGEMGRTPKINKRGGRDHWARLAPLLIYGGNAGRGQIVGRSNRDGGEPAEGAVDSTNLIGTILQTVLNSTELRLKPEFDAVSRLASVNPIPGTV